jgi:uncharacterized damage-inducible protein DinB
MNAQALLDTLKAEISAQNQKAVTFLEETPETLNREPVPGKWTALQCVAHLNSYASHYLPAFERSIAKSAGRNRNFANEIKSTWLGEKCIQSVLVTNTKKMKAPSRHNHRGKTFDKTVIGEFMQHQQRLLQVLEKAGTVHLGKTYTRIEIMPLLRLHLGDFLQFFVYHQTRHLAQAERALEMQVRSLQGR